MPARKTLGHTEVVALKLHPDLMSYVQKQAEANYCSVQEYLRKMILADKERFRAEHQ